MCASVLFSPTKAFEDAFHNEDIKGAFGIVLISGILMALASFFISANIYTSIYFVLLNFAEWLLFSGFVWFFEFVHVRKKKRLIGISYAQCLSVVGKLWAINLVGALVFALTALFGPMVSSGLLMFLGVLFILFSIILTVAWLVGSYKLLKVVLGVTGSKLALNWIILTILYGLTLGIILSLL
ncbi:MAG: hypothetical protein WCW44_01600 [archaeon]|jgi:hypothetical protein